MTIFASPLTLFSIFILFLTFGTFTSCAPKAEEPAAFTGEEGEIRLMTLNPGHFHAALVQKNMLRQVDPTVYIFAPEGNDLELHKERIEGFNTRDENPTSWELDIYTGDDYLERMIAEQPGNVMVVACNNRSKTDYILLAVDE